MLSIDWSISVGNILTVVILGLGAIKAFYQVKGDISVLMIEFKNLEKAQISIGDSLGLVANALSQLAVQQNQIDNLRRELDEMKRGHGFILDLPAGRGPK